MLRGWDEGFAVPSFGIVIDNDWRGRGVGSGLTDFTLDEARSLGSPGVRLSVYSSHLSAVRLYAERGFVETRRETVQTPFGEDAIIVMSKTFATEVDV